MTLSEEAFPPDNEGNPHPATIDHPRKDVDPRSFGSPAVELAGTHGELSEEAFPNLAGTGHGFTRPAPDVDRGAHDHGPDN